MTALSSNLSSRMQGAAIFVLVAALVLTPVVYFAVFDRDRSPDTAQIVLVEKLGGDTTAFTSTRNAFGLPARNLESGERRTFVVGNSFFRQNWVTRPPPPWPATAWDPLSTPCRALPATLWTDEVNLPIARRTPNEAFCSA